MYTPCQALKQSVCQVCLNAGIAPCCASFYSRNCKINYPCDGSMHCQQFLYYYQHENVMAPMVNYFNMPIGELNPKSVLQISDQDFHGHFYCFTGTLFEFFHGKRFFFHGWNLTKIFTGTSCISRALFGQNLVFFTGGFFFFTGEKKHCVVGVVKFFKQ